jgi:hypothetical protein
MASNHKAVATGAAVNDHDLRRRQVAPSAESNGAIVATPVDDKKVQKVQRSSQSMARAMLTINPASSTTRRYP